MLKAVLFDLDGTLIYTLIDLMNAVNYSLEKLGYNTRSIDEIRTFIGNGINKLVERSLPTDKSKLDTAISYFKSYYDLHSKDHTYVYEGIYELLNQIKELNLKIIVITNKDQNNADELIKFLFNNSIDLVVGATNDCPKKPKPDMIYKALNNYNLKNNEVIYVGDTNIDYDTCINSNIKCILCSWGYRNKEDLLKLNNEYIIDKPFELLNIIKKL